jgi:class 3 adenylate cyclase/pimeloyl-ACP methyl ester carboxylesterase
MFVVAGNEVPETRFASLGEDRIAYQVLGEGPIDLVLCPSSGDCIDLAWDWSPYAEFLRRLASVSRLIMFDRRGRGASDAVSGETLPGWELWAEDVRAVLDTVGSERAVVLGAADSGPTAILFAAIHPDRTQGLILANTVARSEADDDYPFGLSEAEATAATEVFTRQWGTEDLVALAYADAAHDPAIRRWAARTMRLAMTGKDASDYFRWLQHTDVREVLPSIRVPTLVLHRENYKYYPAELGRDLAERIPGAQFALVPGADAVLFSEPNAEIFEHIEQFLTGLRAPIDADRALAAILFTDIVGSTERAAEVGDREWGNLMASHDTLARTIVDQHQGRLIRTTGDGMLATFDGPGRAIRCARAFTAALQPLGLEVRAGVHTGEIELRGPDIAGIGVHIGQRVSAVAQPGEVLVSRTVVDLVTGSGIEFDDRGEHNLKGVPGAWHLFAVQQ